MVLCDGLLIVCSQSGTRRPSSSTMSGPGPGGHGAGELRYRDKHLIRHAHLQRYHARVDYEHEDEQGFAWRRIDVSDRTH